MKMRALITVSIIAASLTGCWWDKNTDTNKAKEQPKENPANAEPKLDLDKAAMLNIEMGEKYLEQGHVVRAKKKFLHALELKPKSPEVHTSLGYFYETVGDIKEAEVHYKKAISFAENSKGQFYNNYGTFLCRQQRYKDADKAFNQAFNDKFYVDTATAYENAGLCALKKPDLNQAYTYLQTAVQRDPRLQAATLELANLELIRNNYPAAKEYVDRLLMLGHENPRTLALGIQVNTKLGKFKEVAEAKIKLKKNFPDSAECQQYTAFAQ